MTWLYDLVLIVAVLGPNSAAVQTTIIESVQGVENCMETARAFEERSGILLQYPNGKGSRIGTLHVRAQCVRRETQR